MLFNSLSFVVFFLVVFALYYTPALRRHQVWLLVAASLVFYAWAYWKPVVLLAGSIGWNAWLSHRVMFGEPRHARRLAVIGVIGNVTLLAAAKYLGLFAGTFAAGLIAREPVLEFLLRIPLPIGISFFTFEGISLLVDVFRQPEEQRQWGARSFGRHLRDTSLFVSFFPHLIAGPILKAKAFMPQIGEKRLRDVDWEAAARHLIAGYFLKMVVADNLRDLTVHLAFPFDGLHPIDLLLLLVGYSCQIFADFAGYSLIAIGLAGLLGYQLIRNFNYPYVATSFAEFWHRWHISLSSWLRDYLYIPLGGNRRGVARTYVNLTVVMFLGGLWHGAAWSYAVWGATHGIALMLERALTQPDAAPPRGWIAVLRGLLVFTVVTFAWVLFKLPDFDHVAAFFRALGTVPAEKFRFGAQHFYVLLFALPVVLFHRWHRQGRNLEDHPAPWPHAVMLALLVLNHGFGGSFIYFRF